MTDAARPKIFVSYNSNDKNWAEWIAWELEEAGYQAVIQAWDFLPGSNFVLEMQRAAAECERTIAVLSPNYLSSRFTAPEWAAAFADDPTGESRKLVLVRVLHCNTEGLLKPLIYADLVGLSEDEARTKLLSCFEERLKPKTKPPFAGGASSEPPSLTATPKPTFPATLPRYWNVPDKNVFFTGRVDVLQKLEQEITSNKRAALHGLGGTGKTQIAIEYAHRHCDRYEAVFWVKADNELNLTSGFTQIARQLDLPFKEAHDIKDIISVVKNALQTRDLKWLLIFDNADTPELLKGYLPQNPKGHILLTSRAHVFDRLNIARAVEILKMEPDESVDFLLQRTGRNRENIEEEEAARKLAEELGYLPLALEQAAAFIIENGSRFFDYLTSYRKRRIELLEEHEPVAGDYPESVRTTWKLNFDEVAKYPASIEALRLSAFLSPDNIPLEVLTEGTSGLHLALSDALANTKVDPLLLDRLLKPLVRYSLIQRETGETYSLHRLVQDVIKLELSNEERHMWASYAVTSISHTFPEVKFENWLACDRLMTHAVVCNEYIEQFSIVAPESVQLLDKAGSYLFERGQYAAAEPLLQSAANLAEQACGSDSPITAEAYNDLAILYAERHNIEDAELLYQRSLAIREKVLGPEHSDTATSLNNLAMLYQVQDKFTLAEPLHERSLAIKESILGPEHPDTATSLNNLAMLYQVQDKFTLAEPLYERSLAIRESILGPEHPDTASSLNNLAALYQAQDKFTLAEPLYERSLAINESVLGPEHPDTASSLNNLAMLYKKQNKFTLAEPLHERSLAIRESILGPEHPDTATSLSNLAMLYQVQDKFTLAEPLYERSLAIRESILGPEHPDTATSLNNLAGLYEDQGQFALAEQLFIKAAGVLEKLEHPSLLTVLRNHLVLSYRTKRQAQVVKLKVRIQALEKKMRVANSATASGKIK